MSLWSDAPLVFVTEIHCPSCLSPRPIIVRSVAGGDRSRSRRCVCRSCSGRFILVIEPSLPEFGKSQLDIP